MPRDIERVFQAVGLSLFPASERDLAMDCSCPDYAVPCKHLAAVCYVLAERFDADPFQILAMRGRHRDALLEELRSRRSAAPPPVYGEDLSEAMAGDLPEQLAGPRTPPDALLDQVPPFPIEVRGEHVAELLRPAYQAMATEA
jgi:uncharacterized Zn finger protein